jgi:hypothetical protein
MYYPGFSGPLPVEWSSLINLQARLKWLTWLACLQLVNQ